MRRRLRNRQVLFSAGDVARHVFVVERGRLAIGNAAIGQFAGLGAGDALLLECGQTRALDCEAATDAIVLVADRRLIAKWAAAEPELADEIARLHAAELKLMLAAISTSLATGIGKSDLFVEEGVDEVHLTVDLPDRRCGWPSGAETGTPSAPRSGILPFRRSEGETWHG